MKAATEISGKVTAAVVIEKTGLKASTVRTNLRRLANAGWLKQVSRGGYILPGTNEPGESSDQPPQINFSEGPADTGNLKEQGRSICLSLVGPDGQVLARLDMVLMGVEQPLKVPLTLGVEGGGVGSGE